MHKIRNGALTVLYFSSVSPLVAMEQDGTGLCSLFQDFVL